MAALRRVARVRDAIRPSDDSLGCYRIDRKSTRLNSSHANISYAVFCLKKKNKRLNSNQANTPYAVLRFKGEPHNTGTDPFSTHHPQTCQMTHCPRAPDTDPHEFHAGIP